MRTANSANKQPLTVSHCFLLIANDYNEKPFPPAEQACYNWFMDFNVYHKYQRAVDNGLAEQLSCPDDGDRLFVMMLDPNADEPEPMLKCYTCGKRIIPGLDLEDRLRKANELLQT